MADLRTFAVEARLCAPTKRSFSDLALLAALRTWVRSGLLAVVRQGSPERDSQDPVDAERQRVVRAIQRERPKGVDYRGRRYRLVLDSQLHRLAIATASKSSTAGMRWRSCAAWQPRAKQARAWHND